LTSVSRKELDQARLDGSLGEKKGDLGVSSCVQ
jgi:hypothetical protein